jgi:hypothetical protein
MFQGLSQLLSLLRNPQALREKMARAEETARQTRVTATAGGGMVSVEANGARQILNCRIEPHLLRESEQELLEELVVSAANQALERAQAAAVAEVEKQLGDIPGLAEAMARMGGGKTA